MHLDLIFPLTCKLLDSVNWTGISISLDLTKAVLKQPYKLVNNPLYLHLDVITHIT
jgi:protein-S-isoprenylcysteine O-methyltransferase Ste14